jgi:hypothetical protein
VAQEQPDNSQRNPADHLVPYRFKPGASGNPGGRPKNQSLTAILREKLAGTSLGGHECLDGKTVAEAVVEAVLAHIVNTGNAALFREVMQRIDGKIPDPEPQREITLADLAAEAEALAEQRRAERARATDQPAS